MLKLNTKFKKIGAPILAGALVLSTAVFYVPTLNTANADTEKTINENFSDLLSNAESGDKSETVYAVMDADGNTSEVSVSEWLKNSGSSKTIKDYSTLKNIKNTSGDEKVTKNGNDLVWKANGKDISYTGDYEGELPVQVKIHYYLDGTEMSAKEIAGKSGNVKIRFDYEVNDSVSSNGYNMTRPYTMISAVVLSNDNFSNVSVNSGKAINDGNNTAVAGIALPGVSEDLNIDSLDIPDHVTITAKTTNFEIDGTYTVAASGFMSDADTSKLDDASSEVDTLESSLNQLSSASKKLVNGTSKLSSGASTLSDSTSQIEEGTKTLETGAKKLDSGVSALSTGVNTLSSGAQQLSAGATNLQAGTKQLEEKVIGTSKDDTSSLSYSTAALKTGAKQVSDGMTTLAKTIKEQNTSIATTVQKISTTLASVNTEEVTAPSHDSVDSNLDDAIKVAEKSGDQDTVDALKKVQESLTSYEKDVDDTVSGVNDDSKAVQTAKAIADKLVEEIASTSTDSLDQLEKGAKSVSDGTSKLDAAVEGKDDKGNYKDGTLAAGVQSLNTGAAKLNAGITASDQGLSQLQESVNKSLKSGTSQLSSGSSKIVKYMGQLSEGAETLSSGTDTLSSSMKKFNKQGIQKLVSTMDDADLDTLISRAQATVDAASEGSFVGGKLDSQNGESKIIFKTDEVKK